MTTSIDSNVLIALWDEHLQISQLPRRILDRLRFEQTMLICACVYAELMAGPGRSAPQLDEMIADTRMEVDWKISQEVWRLAGERFSAYAAQRRAMHNLHPRRILADFVIGAHAEINGYDLFTFDQRLYRQAFPKVRLTDLV